MTTTTTPTPPREDTSDGQDNGRATKVTSFRRNGKLQSCEPCRKGKLRCDHTIPSCARCVRRGKPEQCIYHPAPLTKPRQSSAGVSANVKAHITQQKDQYGVDGHTNGGAQRSILSPPDSTETSVHHDRSSFQTTPLSSGPAAPGLSSLAEASLYVQQNTRRGVSSKDPKIGFLGTSSYSAVYTENAPNLGIDVQEGMERSDSPPASPLSMERIKAGAELLSLLSDLHIYEQVMSRWFEIADGMMIIRPVYDIWMREIWNEFGPLLKSFKSVKDLYGFSELVWRNTLDSMPLDAHTTGRKWALLGTGRNLRWETVGLIFSGVGVLGSSLGDRDAIFTVTGVKDRSIFARTMRDAVESCIGFCRESECTNEGFACLLYESAVLLESLRGDTYYGAWTRLGETCDLLVLMGLHQEKKVNASTSFFICQLRIRMFEEVYGHDKAMATFLGRPPRLSHRYCVLQLPLDLTDNEMLLEGPELEDALSRLEDGWNTSNQFHRVTWRRVWAQHARIREDILEIALGNSDSMITERGNAIRDQLAHLKTTMPAFMRTDPSEILAAIQPSGQMLPRRTSSFSPAPAPAPANSTHDILCLLCMHHGIRHTDFLLNRALVNRGHAPPTSLIAPARSLLSLLLQTMAKRDYFRDFQIDLVCLLAFHGLPSAGVLAIELLKQEQRGVYLTSDILPRSETIQDLSVFISALAAVGPGEGNHAICNQGRRALKRLLDKILSPDPVVARPPPPQLAAANTAHNGVDVTDVGSDGVGGASSLTDEEQVQLLHSAAGVAGVLHGVTHHNGTHHQNHHHHGHHQQQQQQQDQGWQGLYFPTGNDAEFLQWLEDVEWDRGSWLNPV